LGRRPERVPEAAYRVLLDWETLVGFSGGFRLRSLEAFGLRTSRQGGGRSASAMGLASALALMFAHHMNDGSMFSAFASYSDAGFAAEHDEILLQTPEGNARLRVVAVDVVDSNVEHKRLDFATDEELSSWLDELLGRADVALVDGARTDSVKAFCTCSYGRWNGHERTIVYAQEEVG
jgi:sortase B